MNYKFIAGKMRSKPVYGKARKIIYCFFIASILNSCSQTNSKIGTGDISEFCDLGVQYFDSLLKNMEYVLWRSANGWMFDIDGGYRIVISKNSDNKLFYKEINTNMDSSFYDINSKEKEFEDRYSVKISNIEEIIDYCERMRITEIRNRPNLNFIAFSSSSFDVRYTKSPPLDYEEILCENWYFSKRETNSLTLGEIFKNPSSLFNY